MATVIVLFMLLGLTFAVPATNDFDKVSADDVEINSIHTGNKFTAEASTAGSPTPQNSVNLDVKVADVPAGPQHPATSFARIIDDIFNIPISVLQSVARLLTNPFKQPLRSPEDTKTY